jgi:hypothetical protein
MLQLPCSLQAGPSLLTSLLGKAQTGQMAGEMRVEHTPSISPELGQSRGVQLKAEVSRSGSEGLCPLLQAREEEAAYAVGGRRDSSNLRVQMVSC